MSKYIKPEITVNSEKDFCKFNDTIKNRYFFYDYYRIFVIRIILKLSNSKWYNIYILTFCGNLDDLTSVAN